MSEDWVRIPLNCEGTESVSAGAELVELTVEREVNESEALLTMLEGKVITTEDDALWKRLLDADELPDKEVLDEAADETPEMVAVTDPFTEEVIALDALDDVPVADVLPDEVLPDATDALDDVPAADILPDEVLPDAEVITPDALEAIPDVTPDTEDETPEGNDVTVPETVVLVPVPERMEDRIDESPLVGKLILGREIPVNETLDAVAEPELSTLVREPLTEVGCAAAEAGLDVGALAPLDNTELGKSGIDKVELGKIGGIDRIELGKIGGIDRIELGKIDGINVGIIELRAIDVGMMGGIDNGFEGESVAVSVAEVGVPLDASLGELADMPSAEVGIPLGVSTAELVDASVGVDEGAPVGTLDTSVGEDVGGGVLTALVIADAALVTIEPTSEVTVETIEPTSEVNVDAAWPTSDVTALTTELKSEVTPPTTEVRPPTMLVRGFAGGVVVAAGTDESVGVDDAVSVGEGAGDVGVSVGKGDTTELSVGVAVSVGDGAVLSAGDEAALTVEGEVELSVGGEAELSVTDEAAVSVGEDVAALLSVVDGVLGAGVEVRSPRAEVTPPTTDVRPLPRPLPSEDRPFPMPERGSEGGVAVTGGAVDDMLSVPDAAGLSVVVAESEDTVEVALSEDTAEVALSDGVGDADPLDAADASEGDAESVAVALGLAESVGVADVDTESVLGADTESVLDAVEGLVSVNVAEPEPVADAELVADTESMADTESVGITAEFRDVELAGTNAVVPKPSESPKPCSP
ncbi:uncharacterized protein PHACADRAFT_201387 [Phanerochaete carnosa HHB-10118-sp]|uniref:Uncharacterized protein n=1 Tax=Phanerochaete carnosa (strain HHB-10118-sp) TaxID=650164 RepID=K5VEV7_PHACS|nr:uncharacterized protein PHACADRAFT_201387 [Phanerochaete carnosa HHB-10118-sp]EKM49698.1 hypothetical protein PHACADRAFT_201387 [Phanerochaete carnosa HHB-10118-sp]